MLVVSDTSPITNLIQINLLNILKDIYGQIVIPQTVYDELCEIESQKKIIDEQSWIHILSAQNTSLVSSLETELDSGESESIALSIEIHADYLIIDEIKGRQKAESMGIRIVGLLGTLLKAKDLRLIPLIRPVVERLIHEIGFHINPQLKAHILAIAGE
jgi:uncharacterized protein